MPTQDAPQDSEPAGSRSPVAPSKHPLAAAVDFPGPADTRSRERPAGSSSARIPVFRAPAPLPPVVGGFRIVSPLESSVLGRTYRAANASGSPVVLTLIERDDPALRDRVKAALAVLEKVDHPNVAHVVGHGTEGEHHYYALGVPDCLTLLDFVRRGRPLDGAEVAWVGASLASALGALHAKGLAHGDVTPVNVGIAREGHVVLVDLGWAPRVRDPQFDSKLADASLADLGQLAATLVFATTGQAAKPKTSGKYARPTTAAGGQRLMEKASWLTPALADLLDILMDDPQGRPNAAETERRLREAGKEVGVGDAPPQDLIDTARALMDDRPTGPDRTTAAGNTRGSPAPPLGGFGRYVLIEEIARGGMGVVYRARHAELNRLFALKVLLAGDIAGDVTRKRFLREAEAAAQLDHPSIVRVHDFGEHEGRAYLAMDFAEGRSLSSLVGDPGFALPRLLGLLAKVCDAVHYAHSRGIIHRDLKPQNVVVDKSDVPHILDFGVAKRLDESQRGAGTELTTEGELVGTPAYMPPEQAEGRAKDIDTRSDVYALGVILYELATQGRLPFEGLTVTDVLTKVLLEDAPAPSKLKPEIPWEIDAICLKAIEKDPKRRYQSAAELASDLRLFLEGRPITAKGATRLYRLEKWARRNRRVLPFAAVAVLALASVPIVLAHQASVRRAADEKKLQQLVAQADAALKTDGEAATVETKLKEALDAYSGALLLDPSSKTAAYGKFRTELLLSEIAKKREAERRAESDRAQARELVQEGEQRLKEQNADAAQKAFTQALAFDHASDEARDGLARAAVLAEKAARSREAEQRAREADEQARNRVVEGESALAHDDAEAARRAFFQALAFKPSSAEAQDGLRRADRIAYELEQKKQQARNGEEASRLIASAQTKLSNLDFAAARADFTKALAFDGQNQDAVAGLRSCEKLERDLAAADAKRKNREAADELQAKGDDALARGRALAKDDADRSQIRDAYFEAMEAYDRASFLADDLVYKKKKQQAAAELGALSRNQQEYGLAQFLFRIAGTSADAAADQAPAVDDDCLVVREADAILVQRAFREPLSFDEKATKEFLKEVRALVEPRKDRYRLLVDVRTHAVAGPNPVVYLTGVHLRLQDLKANTTSAPEQIDFDGNGYQRIVVAGTAGRMVPSIDKALANDAPQVLQKIKDRAQALLAAAEKK